MNLMTLDDLNSADKIWVWCDEELQPKLCSLIAVKQISDKVTILELETVLPYFEVTRLEKDLDLCYIELSDLLDDEEYLLASMITKLNRAEDIKALKQVLKAEELGIYYANWLEEWCRDTLDCFIIEETRCYRLLLSNYPAVEIPRLYTDSYWAELIKAIELIATYYKLTAKELFNQINKLKP